MITKDNKRRSFKFRLKKQNTADAVLNEMNEIKGCKKSEFKSQIEVFIDLSDDFLVKEKI